MRHRQHSNFLARLLPVFELFTSFSVGIKCFPFMYFRPPLAKSSICVSAFSLFQLCDLAAAYSWLDTVCNIRVGDGVRERERERERDGVLGKAVWVRRVSWLWVSEFPVQLYHWHGLKERDSDPCTIQHLCSVRELRNVALTFIWLTGVCFGMRDIIQHTLTCSITPLLFLTYVSLTLSWPSSN